MSAELIAGIALSSVLGAIVLLPAIMLGCEIYKKYRKNNDK